MTPAGEAAIELQRNARVSHDAINDGSDMTDTPPIPLASDLDAARATLLGAASFDREQEWHITVTGASPVAWVTFCRSLGVDPLFLELNDGRLQLLGTLRVDPRAPLLANDLGPSFLELCTENEGWKVVRVKHEVRTLLAGEVAFYHEVHAKLDGPWRKDRRGSSRDLLRPDSPAAPGRWYLTQRSTAPIDPDAFAKLTRTFCKGSTLAGVETEAVLEDTNIALDAGWL